MKLSHILYKVNTLEEGVEAFRKKGFHVEYGSRDRPHNALIYFSEGPYIELLAKAPISSFARIILKCIGKKKVVDRFRFWEAQKEGFFSICLENYKTHFNTEKVILKKFDQKFFITKSQRKDPFGRLLKWKLLFPYELKIPFFMTYFNINPKPKDAVHPNGIKKVQRVSFGTDEGLIPIINQLCDDDTLELHVGSGIHKVTYEK